MRNVIAGTAKKSMEGELLAVIPQECPPSTRSKQLDTEEGLLRRARRGRPSSVSSCFERVDGGHSCGITASNSPSIDFFAVPAITFRIYVSSPHESESPALQRH